MGSHLLPLIFNFRQDRRGRYLFVQPIEHHLVFFNVSIGIDEHIELVLKNRAPNSMQLFNEARI